MMKSTRSFAILAGLAASLALAACGGGEDAVKPDSAPIISTPQPGNPSNPTPAEPAQPLVLRRRPIRRVPRRLV
jgi:ABC-type oligopeptide transport system substrate-binding subunit